MQKSNNMINGKRPGLLGAGWLATGLLTLGLALGSASASAQQPVQKYPSKTITILLTSSFGGTYDVLVRGIADDISAKTGTSVVVEPKPGGGGAVGLGVLAHSAPDGHTIAMTFGGALLVSPHTTPGLGWTLDSFTPITRLVSSPNIFVGAKDFPARSFADLIRMAKQKPESVSVALGGAGNKMWMALIESRTGAKFLWVPVSTVPFLAALNGTANAAVETPSTVEAMLKDGRLHNLGVGTKGTYAYMPDAEPLSKTIPGFEMNFWWGMVAPAGLPKDRLQWLYQHITAALNETQLKARMFAYGYELIHETPEQFAAYLKATDELDAKIIREYHIQ
jgi:tripartite-type tricarboxylate transporter receptor subunit TctC